MEKEYSNARIEKKLFIKAKAQMAKDLKLRGDFISGQNAVNHCLRQYLKIRKGEK